MSDTLNRSALARQMLSRGDDRQAVIEAIQRTGSTRDSAMSLISIAQRQLRGDKPAPILTGARRRTKGSQSRDKLRLNLKSDAVQCLEAESAARGTYSGTLAAVLIEIICDSGMFDAVLDGELPRKAAP